MSHRFLAAITVLCNGVITLLPLLVVIICTLTSAASLDSTVSNPRGNVLSSNISYWKSSTSFPLKNKGLESYAVIQLRSTAGPDFPDEIFLIGGTYCTLMQCTTSTDVWKSSDEGSSWTRVSSSLPPRYFMRADSGACHCLAPDSNILIVGGSNDSDALPQDSYISRDRGVSWNLIASDLPFASYSPFCAFDTTGKYVFVWPNSGYFSQQENTHLFRGTYDGTSITNWVNISTPVADGQSLDERYDAAMLVLPNSNQLLIGGGGGHDLPRPGYFPPIVKEVLSLTLPTTGNVSTITRINVTADWPYSVNGDCFFFTDSRQNLYFFASGQDTWGKFTNGSNLWKAASTASFDSWIPVDQNSSCSVEYDPYWFEFGLNTIFPSSAGGTDRLIVLPALTSESIYQIALDYLNEESMEILASEQYIPVTLCPLPPDDPSKKSTWYIYVIIGVASAVVITGLTCLCRRKKPAPLGINSPLLNA